MRASAPQHDPVTDAALAQFLFGFDPNLPARGVLRFRLHAFKPGRHHHGTTGQNFNAANSS
jgi:hypothetical protein